VQCNDEEIVAAAAEGGADPISLKYLIRPLLALRDADRGDPVMWAKELSLIAGCHDSEVLSEAAKRVAASGGQCPTIKEIAEECEEIDLEIGGQKSLPDYPAASVATESLRSLRSHGCEPWPGTQCNFSAV
jgi:hypothetical protein